MNQCVAGQNLLLTKPKTKKKKNPRNAFSFFLDDAVKELRRQGQHVASKKEAVPLANQKWKDLTLAEKARYEEKAREWKIQQKQVPKSGRLDCTGQLIDNRVNMEEFTENQRKQARKVLQTDWPAGKGVCDVHFYIISFQSLFELPDEEGYQPCEVACIDYTLNRGIEKVWHHFIDPGPLKLGMRAEIRIFAEKTHRIPEEGFDLASDQYHVMWNELLHFVKPDNSSSHFPPLLCKMSEMRKTLYCLDWLSAHAGVSNKLHKVFELEDIAAQLFSHGGMMRPSLTIIEEGCSSHMYDYEADTSCKYHEELECIHCALLNIKKCCFWMSDSLSKVYGYEITDTHLPVRKAPSFIITKPEMVAMDNQSRHQDRMRDRNQRYNRSPGGDERSRDTRFRATYDVVPSRVECTDFDPRPLASVRSPARGEPPNDGHGSIPSLGHVKRPTSSPLYTRQQQPRTGNRLAANFQMKPKSDFPYSGGACNLPCEEEIDKLSQDFDASSLSSVDTSATDENSAQKQTPRAYLGRGRGRGRGRFL